MKTDAEIQKDVMAELSWTPLLNASEIGVAVKDGIVTLSGTVNTFAKKIAAEDAAQRVSGVKAVAEDLVVKLFSFGKKTDTEIAEAVLNALKWNSSLDENKIKIKVEDAWVTLEGEAEWEFQRNVARKAVENLNGVVGISNNIKLKHPVTAFDVRNKISAALHRSATVDAEKIKLQVDGRKVILTGTVRSYAEKRDAANAAWAAPGVDRVENNIEIDTDVFVY